MKYKLEFSQIFRRKINSLKRDLTKEYGKDKAKEAVSEIMTIAKGLATNPNAGKALSELFEMSGRTQESIVAVKKSRHN